MTPQSSLQAFCTSRISVGLYLTEMQNFPRLINKEEHSSATSVNPPAAILATEPSEIAEIAILVHGIHGIWILQVQTPNWTCSNTPRLKSLCSSVTACSSSGATSPPDMMAYSKPGAMGWLVWLVWCGRSSFWGEFPTWIFRETLGHHGLARSGRTIEHGMLKRHSSSSRSSG